VKSQLQPKEVVPAARISAASSAPRLVGLMPTTVAPLILGGPVGDGEQTLHVVEAAEKQVRERLADDP
jgi:hypothetical protein